MYESPINIISQDIGMQIVKQLEHTVVEAIRKCDVVVDKDELIKALNYDRNQYSKGYKDGANDVLDKIKDEIDRQQKWLLHAGYTAYNVDIALDAIKSVVAESEERK